MIKAELEELEQMKQKFESLPAGMFSYKDCVLPEQGYFESYKMFKTLIQELGYIYKLTYDFETGSEGFIQSSRCVSKFKEFALANKVKMIYMIENTLGGQNRTVILTNSKQIYFKLKLAL